MLQKEMTRKEFLAYLGSLLGLFILSRLPWSGSTKTPTLQKPDAYGNNTYGG